MKYIIILLISTLSTVYAERWVVLPPRIELQSERMNAGELARLIALYLRASRVSEIVSVTEAEACLKNANASMDQKISTESLAAVTKNCLAERLLVFRIRKLQADYEVTSKVFFRESGSLTDTLTNTGPDLMATLGQNLKERFGSSPVVTKENAIDLIITGDTYGGSYFEWGDLKPFFLSLDAIKASYCLLGADGKVLAQKPTEERARQKEFIEKIKFQGSGMWSEASQVLACSEEALKLARREGRRAILVFVVSDAPREHAVKVNLRAAMRKFASKATILIAAASTTNEETRKFWASLTRELGETAYYLPIAQHAKVGLSNGGEWHIYRQNGRVYESREAKIKNLTDGVKIPDKYAQDSAPQDLVKLYEKLSGNKVISDTKTQIDASQLRDKLSALMRANDKQNVPSWRVLMNQNGQSYYLSLSAVEARRLTPNSFARIFVELKPPSENEIVRNRPSPAFVLTAAHDSPQAYEINVSEYIKNPARYLRKSIGSRSFYILTGNVVRIIPPEGDAIENGF